ncbi:hypothetical protein BHM03_00035464 [Ensete ventricosum]|nr:hypothetical protein BHM03_00035464 [Ensete ventricosum]
MRTRPLSCSAQRSEDPPPTAFRPTERRPAPYCVSLNEVLLRVSPRPTSFLVMPSLPTSVAASSSTSSCSSSCPLADTARSTCRSLYCLPTDSPRDTIQFIEWSPRSCPRALLVANFHGRITIWTQPSHVRT